MIGNKILLIAVVFLLYHTFARACIPITARKAAFTLAEVLITLAIIGVVAAMTIPAVLNHTKETQLKSGLKKAQSVLSSALESVQYDTGLIANQTNYRCYKFYSVFKEYFSGIKFNDSTNHYDLNGTYYTYNGYTKTSTSYLDDGQIVLNDGTLLIIENSCTLEFLLLSVDINGFENKPNKWGHDLFTFEVDEQTGELLPAGHPNTHFSDNDTYCSKTSYDTSNGVGCTYKALTEKDYFKNLP
ncbi:MAG: type II secretion system GspH family protein [Candidatus Gastranaerophilales bacterium]|nr:type II secretion system GspH family protein [Candidatus Gastranaerophilales bacterium]